MMNKGKVIVFSAPSGSGKSTLISYLMQQGLRMSFSISCTSRPPRGTEKHGVDYYYLSLEEFRSRIATGDFIEYEEVYKDRYYGTLKSEVEERLLRGENVVLDIDVAGGVNLKKQYGSEALLLFIMPPSIEVLRQRLEGRGTDLPEVIDSRIAKAEYELGFKDQYDVVIVNDDLATAEVEALKVLKTFLSE